MAGHAIFAALCGLLVLATYILTVGDPGRALLVWVVGAGIGAFSSLLWSSNAVFRRWFVTRRT